MNRPHDLLFGHTSGQHPLGRWVDHRETYGMHVVERFAASLPEVRRVVDLGAGSGRDVAIVKRLHPEATTIAVEGGREYAAQLAGKVDHVHVANIERDVLPFEDGSIDLVIANQILEHTKEVFWIFHEVTRCLRVGGHLLIGVPNIASLHNRVLLLLGRQPTQHKLCSAHVRPFSKPDTLAFLEACFPHGYRLVDFRGAQFYPFPRRIARALASAVPTAAFSIFFLLRKERPYRDGFLTYPARALFETNFWVGHVQTGSQY